MRLAVFCFLKNTTGPDLDCQQPVFFYLFISLFIHLREMLLCDRGGINERCCALQLKRKILFLNLVIGGRGKRPVYFP